MSTNHRPSGNVNVVAICVTVIICFAFAAVVAAFVAAPNGANPGSLITIILTTLPGSIAAITALVKANQIHDKADSIQADTTKILNGVMDRKIQDNVRTVMTEFHSPESVEVTGDDATIGSD